MARGISSGINAIYIIFHLFSLFYMAFLRFYPGKDNSHSIGSTFDRCKYGFGWWDSYIQWGFWVSFLYFLFASFGDCLMRRLWRKHRDIFFLFTFTIMSSISFCYWLIYVPIKGTPKADTWDVIVESYLSTSTVCFLLWIELFIITHKYGSKIIGILMSFSFFLGYVLSETIYYALTGERIVDIEKPWIYWTILGSAHILFYIIGRSISSFMRKIRMKGVCCEKLLYDSDSEIMDDIRVMNPLVQRINDPYLNDDSCMSLVMPCLSVIISVVIINVIFMINFLLVERSNKVCLK